MTERFDLDEVLERNPQVDRDELMKTLEQLGRRRMSRGTRKGYDLVPPYGGRRMGARDNALTEPRPLPVKHPTEKPKNP